MTIVPRISHRFDPARSSRRLLAFALAAAIGTGTATADRFSPPRILAGGTPLPGDAVPADLDGDGDLDLVVCASAQIGNPNLSSRILWFENLGGSFGFPRFVVSEHLGPHHVAAGDLDGDGDVDLAAGTGTTGLLAWYENTGGGRGFTRHEFAGTSRDPEAIRIADLDGDGDGDLLVAAGTYDLVAWHENLDGAGTFGPEQAIVAGIAYPTTVDAADLDGDGDLDVLTASQWDHEILWYENVDGQGAFGPGKFVATFARKPRSVIAADLDGDGDLDVCAAHGYQSSWCKNLDGQGTFGNVLLVDSVSGSDAMEIGAEDLDGDGDRDLVVAWRGGDAVVWHENTNGVGGFGARQVITTAIDAPFGVTTADLDGDGDLEVVSVASGSDEVAWYENLDGTPAFGPPIPVVAPLQGPVAVSTADVDGDGDLDVLTASDGDDRVTWYENVDGFAAPPTAHLISDTQNGPQAVVTPDIDGDGDLDVLVASRLDHTLAWHENGDGSGGFGAARIISSAATDVRDAVAADLDGDGDPDVLAACGSVDRVAWFRNDDGLGTFGAARLLPITPDEPVVVRAADLDGDGDLDAIVAAYLDGAVGWCRNLDGLGTFGSWSPLASGWLGPTAVETADLDGDGDLDVLVSSEASATVLWFANLDGAGAFSTARIVTTEADGAADARAADLDGDGDLDIVSASKRDDEIAWYENVDGAGTFGAQQVITTCADRPWGVVAADLDGDGDEDVLSISRLDHMLALYRNGPAASVTFRNGGANPASYAALSLPVLDGTYTAEVDLTVTGHSLAMLAGFAAPASFALGGNTVLVDITHPAGELLGFPIATGPLATFSFGIPPDPAFGGGALSTQAIHVGGVFPYVLTNAQDLCIGY